MPHEVQLAREHLRRLVVLDVHCLVIMSQCSFKLRSHLNRSRAKQSRLTRLLERDLACSAFVLQPALALSFLKTLVT